MPNTQQHTPGNWTYEAPASYLRWVKKINNFLATPNAKIRIHWCADYITAAEWVIEFRSALDKRINAKSSILSGRKLNPTYLANMRRDLVIINNYKKRLKYPGTNILTTPEFQKRYPHINNTPPKAK